MPSIRSAAGLLYPDVDMLRKQVAAVTNRESKAFFYGINPSEDELKSWNLNTEAEHWRAALMGINPDETDWPTDHAQVAADLDRLADEWNAVMDNKLYHSIGVVPPAYKP